MTWIIHWSLTDRQADYHLQNLLCQSANAEAFAKAYLHFIAFASAIKMLRQLNSEKLKKKVFLELRNKFFVREKILFYKTQVIHVHVYSLFMPLFHIFSTHCSSALTRSYFPETLLCYALNEFIDIIHFFLFKYIFLLLKSLCYALN